MELKYKVYDKTTDTMYSSDEYHMTLDLTCKMVYIGENPSDYENETEAVILPYTGVKDINKKESYLGDILKDKVYEYSRKKDIEKRENSFGVVKKEANSNNLYLEWNFKRKYQGEYYWDTNNLPITHVKEYEIVGSIYTDADMTKKEVKE